MSGQQRPTAADTARGRISAVYRPFIDRPPTLHTGPATTARVAKMSSATRRGRKV